MFFGKKTRTEYSDNGLHFDPYALWTLKCAPYWTAYPHKAFRWYSYTSDGDLKTVSRTKIIHYRQLYLNRPDQISFIPVTVDTSGRHYDDFSRLQFLHAHREVSTLTNELPEESDQFRFLHTDSLVNLKGSLGLILEKVSDMRISVPLDLSSRPFIPLPWYKRRDGTPFSNFFP